jgi:hypothetical protein
VSLEEEKTPGMEDHVRTQWKSHWHAKEGGLSRNKFGDT